MSFDLQEFQIPRFRSKILFETHRCGITVEICSVGELFIGVLSFHYTEIEVLTSVLWLKVENLIIWLKLKIFLFVAIEGALFVSPSRVMYLNLQLVITLRWFNCRLLCKSHLIALATLQQYLGRTSRDEIREISKISVRRKARNILNFLNIVMTFERSDDGRWQMETVFSRNPQNETFFAERPVENGPRSCIWATKSWNFQRNALKITITYYHNNLQYRYRISSTDTSQR